MCVYILNSNAFKSEKPRFHCVFPSCMTPCCLNLSFSGFMLPYLCCLNVCYCWFSSQYSFIPIKHVLCSLVTLVLLFARQRTYFFCCWKRSEGGRGHRLTRELDLSHRKLFTFSPVCSAWHSDSQTLFRNADLRERCIVETIRMAYMTELS